MNMPETNYIWMKQENKRNPSENNNRRKLKCRSKEEKKGFK